MSRARRSDYIELDKQEIQRLYHKENMSTQEVADELGVSSQTVRNRMREYGIRIKTKSEAVQKQKVSISLTGRGYVQWLDHVTLKTVKVHRLLAVSQFSFDVVNEKIVHHINGLKWDNRPDNIELMTPAEHVRHHFEGVPNDQR